MTRTDRDHLRVLSICHYVLGGLCVLCGMFPIIHLVVGIVLVTEPPGAAQQDGPPPEFIGWLFIGIAAFMILCYWALAVALMTVGWCLGRRKGRTFCLVVAGVACLFQPLGTVLGVFTIIVLLRPGVRAAFESPDPEGPAFGPSVPGE
jgi:hypothetical protein